METDGGKVLSKAEIKAARRLKQESQRAAKARLQSPSQSKVGLDPTNTPKSVPPAEKKKTTPVVPQEKVPLPLNKINTISKPIRPTSKTIATRPIDKSKSINVQYLHRVKLFNHLYHDEVLTDLTRKSHGLHPSIIRLGVQYANYIIVGSNARCVALLSAMKDVIHDYKTPPQKEFGRGLEATLQPCMEYLKHCRPISVSMTNASRYVKCHITQLPNSISDADAKSQLQEAIDVYLKDQIDMAAEGICNTVLSKISRGDVLVTFGCSSLVEMILINAHDEGIDFRVIVIDARPLLEGRQLLRRLVAHDIKCSYVLMNAASSIMHEATKVLLGAHALLANGYVMSRAGSSQVALVARSFNVPVLVCCELHKFCERVQTDAFVYNEIADPDRLVSVPSCRTSQPLANWRNIASLTPLNLSYDITPPDLVSAVVTELAILPCTSVPVVLRVKPGVNAHL